MHRYQELEVWKSAVDFSESVYRKREGFPKDERFGLTSQIRRAAVSIPSNIVEGAGRNSNGEFNQFLGISVGSLFELETQLILASRFGYIEETKSRLEKIDLLRKMIFGLQKSLKR